MTDATFAATRVMPREAAVVDTIAARELELFIENDESLYRQMTQPIQRNMLKKQAAGKYDSGRAVRGFQHLADEGARRYNAQFGVVPPGQRSTMRGFDKPTRRAVAESMTRSFEAEAKLGNLSYLLPQGARSQRPRSPRVARRTTLTGKMR